MLLNQINEFPPNVNGKEITYIPQIASLISFFSIILGIISIILIVNATKKQADKSFFIKWMMMYIISAIIRGLPEMMFIHKAMLDYNIIFWNIYGKLIFNIITLIIRIAMIIYPIYVIRKKNKENK